MNTKGGGGRRGYTIDIMIWIQRVDRVRVHTLPVNPVDAHCIYYINIFLYPSISQSISLHPVGGIMIEVDKNDKTIKKMKRAERF